MSFLFGKKKTPAQMMRENQRLLQRAMRDLDRERAAMEKQEQKIIADIKKMAKKNEMGTVRIMAKDLVRTRNTCKKFMLMRANIQGVSLKMTTIKSQHAMSEAMKGVTRAMGRMNKQMNLPQIQKIMQQFEKESEIMDMKEEMMNDVMDDAMGASDDEEESENLVNKVLDELGLENMAEVGAIPSAVGEPAPAQTEEPSADLDADLEARLNNLRR
ncbi:unnamed protein product [Oikopleura dioica]|uniref:Charged multivesicular body protein 2a n=1 Tax=Oikopleura dioica TaxID=34765 RepID=E4YDA6_OIKDI|nr:unnamed protein product [Oikopleura dioica]